MEETLTQPLICSSILPPNPKSSLDQFHDEIPEEDKATSSVSPNHTDNSDFVGVGLVNNHNTCYLNSALQILLCTVPLVSKLNDVTCHRHTSAGDAGDFCYLKALKKLFKLCMMSNSAVIPEEFIRNLNKISPSLQLGYHEDSHEFLLDLLERIDEFCKDETSTDKRSLVREVFGITSILQDICCKCGHQSTTHDPMFFLTLPVSGVNTLISALESYINTEEREGVKCERCDEFGRITQTKIGQAPEVISLHFNRYDNNVQKIYTAMEYPLELDLRPFIKDPKDDEQTIYELYAVVVHSGSTTFGHYLSYVRSSPTAWYQKNDNIVCRVTEAEVLNKMAYMLFYVKKGTPWFSDLDKSEFLLSPKSVLSPSSGDVEKLRKKAKVDTSTNEQEKSGSHDDSPSTSNKYPDYEIHPKTPLSAPPITQVRVQSPKRAYCDSTDPPSTSPKLETFNNHQKVSLTAPTSKIRPQATKRLKLDEHASGMEHVFFDEKFEDDEDDKENYHIPRTNEGQRRIAKNDTSQLDPSLKSLLKGKPKSRQAQLIACMAESKSSPLSSKSAPLIKRLPLSPSKAHQNFKESSCRTKQARTEPFKKSFTDKTLSPTLGRKLF